MCGIVGYTGPQQAAPVLLEGLKKLEYRGYDSAGVAVIERGGIHMVKSAGMIRNLCEKTHDGSVFSGTSASGIPGGPPTARLPMKTPIHMCPMTGASP